jgi:ankyrin repeat protein
MKTEINNSHASITKVVVLGMVLVLGACNEKKASAQKNNSSQSTVKTPTVDIHTAVVTNNVEAIKQHVASGSNLNEKDPFGGSSPLISAALFGKTEIAKILIGAGADINVQNNDGSTALHTASFFCRPEIVKLLLGKGANKTIKNKYGSTAYETVSESFSKVKNVYDMMGNMLAPMGLKLDYPYLEKTRPEIAAMLK